MGEFDHMFSRLSASVLLCGLRYSAISTSVFTKNCLNNTKTERNKLFYSSEFGTFILLIGTHTVGITLK